MRYLNSPKLTNEWLSIDGISYWQQIWGHVTYKEFLAMPSAIQKKHLIASVQEEVEEECIEDIINIEKRARQHMIRDLFNKRHPQLVYLPDAMIEAASIKAQKDNLIQAHHSLETCMDIIARVTTNA